MAETEKPSEEQSGYTLREQTPAPDWKTAAEPITELQPMREQAEPRPEQATLFAGAEESGPEMPRQTIREQTGAVESPVEKPVQDVDNFRVPDHKIVGEALKTYIIVEVGEQIVLIDKHAAHERMNFDRLKQKDRPVPAQQLLAPQTLRLDPEALGLTEEFEELFVTGESL